MPVARDIAGSRLQRQPLAALRLQLALLGGGPVPWLADRLSLDPLVLGRAVVDDGLVPIGPAIAGDSAAVVGNDVVVGAEVG